MSLAGEFSKAMIRTERDLDEAIDSGKLAECEKCSKLLVVGEWPFCPHGFGSNAVVGDDIVGGFEQTNFGHEPEVFYSKKAMARRAKELGLEPFVRHVGEPGSDKSSKTQRWV